MNADDLSLATWLTTDLGEPDWLIPGLLERGQGGFLHGQPGSYKSFLLLQLGLDVASGRSVLSIWPAMPPQPVLLLQAEGTERAWKKRLVNASAGYDVLSTPFFTWHEISVKADSRTGARLVRERLEAVRPALLILDPLVEWMTGSDGDPNAIERWRVVWNEWRSDFKCAILIAQHDRQPIRAFNTGLRRFVSFLGGREELRGRTELLGWADLIMGISRTDQVATLELQKTRESPEEGSKFHFRLEAGQIVPTADGDSLQHWLLAHLEDQPLLADLVSAAAKGTGLKDRTIRRTIEGLIEKGELVQVLEGRRYRLKKGGL